jgi:hypothetical protein
MVSDGSMTDAVELAPARFAMSSVARIGGKVLLLAGAALLLGGLTSFAQGALPDALRPLANSASGWTIPTALLVWALRERAGVSAAFGALAFELLVLGYVLVSQLRGIPDSEVVFLAIGLVGGPVVGAAAAWLHERGWRPAVGAGVLAGVMLGDAAWGLGVVLASTGWIYWTVVGALGLALLVAVALGRGLRRRDLLLAAGTTLATAAAFLAVYTLLS